MWEVKIVIAKVKTRNSKCLIFKMPKRHFKSFKIVNDKKHFKNGKIKSTFSKEVQAENRVCYQIILSPDKIC